MGVNWSKSIRFTGNTLTTLIYTMRAGILEIIVSDGVEVVADCENISHQPQPDDVLWYVDRAGDCRERGPARSLHLLW